jgi:predicted PurR-regulated permease PerM
VERSANQKRWSNLIFGALFVASLLAFGRIMLPFLTPVLIGGFLVVLFLPVHRKLLGWVGPRPSLAAGLSTALLLLLIVIPLSVVTFVVARELLVVLESARVLLADAAFRDAVAARLPDGLVAVLLAEADSQRSQAVLAAVASSAGLVKNLLGAGTVLALDVFLMAVTTYYFFLDGRRLFSEVTRLVPIDRRYVDAFAKEFRDVAYAIVYGNSLTSVLQGAVGLFGLWLAGVPHPAVWGVAMAVVALVPIGGTALVWVPISCVLLLTGKYAEGLFLLGWGTLVVSTLDNFLRPRLCGARMTLHPLLVFLSIFGGLAVFGLKGLLIGPLIASLFMTMVRIYRRDFLRDLRAPTLVEPAEVAPAPLTGPAPHVQTH